MVLIYQGEGHVGFSKGRTFLDSSIQPTTSTVFDTTSQPTTTTTQQPTTSSTTQHPSTTSTTQQPTTTSTTQQPTTACPPKQCVTGAGLVFTSSHPCGECQCLPGWVGPGYECGPDNDGDGWSDTTLNCSLPRYLL